MTTPKQAAALALAEAYCVHYHDHLGQGEEEQNALDDAASAYERTRTQPDAPDLTALERAVVDAVMETAYDDHYWRVHYEQQPEPKRKDEQRLDAALAALRAARTAESDPLVRLRDMLDDASQFDVGGMGYDTACKARDLCYQALAARKAAAK